MSKRPLNLFDLMSTPEKAKILTLFHNDRGYSGTAEEIAIRLGRELPKIRRGLDELVEQGMLKNVDAVYSFPLEMEKELQDLISRQLASGSDRRAR